MKWRLWAPVLVAAAAVSVVALLAGAHAANPQNGSISATGADVTWTGTATGVVATTGEGDCEEGLNCDTFTLNVTGSPADWQGKLVLIELSWLVPTNDYDLYVHKGSNNGPIVGLSGAGAPATTEHTFISPSSQGTGTYTVHAVYFTVVPDQYHGVARVVPGPPPSPVAPPGPAPRFHNFVAPPALGNDAAEPSIGVDWKTGKVSYQSNTETDLVGFDDCTSPAKAAWQDVSAPTSVTTLDPILFCDHRTGVSPNRIFVSQLAGTTSLMSYSDDNGTTWIPTDGGGPSGIDHQSVGAGPFHAPLTRDPNLPVYPNAVYYCSQGSAASFCSRSDDGGVHFTAPVPIYESNVCAGLHGHVKVGPDGTVYVPIKSCANHKQAVAVSETNGLTWSVKPITDSLSGDTDPSVGIASDNTVYIGYDNGDGHPHIAVSHNHGDTWVNDTDVGAAFGIVDTVFPEVVAGDPNRAAFAFLGSASVDNAVWHLYVAYTMNGGATWTTVDVTPNDPVQRGPICTAGLSCAGHRNLLDFMDIDVDKEGRIVVAYADGCVGTCVVGVGASNQDKGTIARQSGGPRLFAANDPVEPAVPGAPNVGGFRDAQGVHLSWPEPDSGGPPITGYKVYRATAAAGPFTLLATTTLPKYLDTTATTGVPYWYRVTAVNAIGEGTFCGALAISGSPTAVVVRSFAARTTRAGVELRWQTASELTLAGFDVLRRAGTVERKVNRSLVRAAGTMRGASYRVVDRTAKPGRRYTYRLVAVSSSGARRTVATLKR